MYILNRNELTQSMLKEILEYNPETGKFIWVLDIDSRARKGDIAGTKGKGYVWITICGFKFSAHRLAFLYMNGEMPIEVDHKNRDKGDNRWCNLISSNRHLNNLNRDDRHIFMFGGIVQTLKDHCKDLGLSYNTIWARVANGMSYEDALATPVKEYRSKKNGTT